MKTLQFKCTLLTDIILNQNAATEGNQTSLDFIPGSNFLGIVAGKLYPKIDSINALQIFHSGKVRFGDAHPSLGSKRGLKVPAMFHVPKEQNEAKEKQVYIPNNSESEKELQLKQSKKDFYCFDKDTSAGTRINVKKNFAIKSAYDRDSRRSKDTAMYGYQSIAKGTIMYFEIELDDDVLFEEKISDAICGKQRIGRSRSAQYGLVEIIEESFVDENTIQKKEENTEHTVYADGRLIFLDEKGMPTFQPSVEQLGFKDGEILWEKCQIRTFQYAPWNFKRQTRDTDRCGLEKGSVFVVKANTCPETSQYVGSYKNEGFGKVIYNPDFLEKKGESNIAKYLLKDIPKPENKEEQQADQILEIKEGDTLLLKLLKRRRNVEFVELKAVAEVNKFIEANKSIFNSESFASQWGNIRKIVMNINPSSLENSGMKFQIEEALFGSDAYLTHGVAKKKWDDRQRRKKLEDFVKTLTDDNAQFAMINLASEMAKKCRRN